MEDYRIPVTIITGFLGAGKTTLLNQLIKQYPQKKFAIIENEFGEIGIDGSLIVGVNENIFELNNGCICCSLNSDFYRTIDQLMDSEYVFNHLLIETTGIADPLSIINAFFDGGGIQDQFKIDSVIGVADAINIEDLIDEHAEIRKQISVSDTLLINKSDSVDQKYLATLTQMLSEINPLATIIPTSFCDSTNCNLLDTDAYNATQIEQSTLGFIPRPNPHHAHHHGHEIATVAFEFPGLFDFSKFSLWIENYMFFNSHKILRIKGILAFEDYQERFIFHSVVNSFLLEPGNKWDEELPFSKLIFIGKHLDKEEIKEGLDQLVI
jgi:G3E family GTPase